MSPICCRNTSSCGSCIFLPDENNTFEYGWYDKIINISLSLNTMDCSDNSYCNLGLDGKVFRIGSRDVI